MKFNPRKNGPLKVMECQKRPAVAALFKKGADAFSCSSENATVPFLSGQWQAEALRLRADRSAVDLDYQARMAQIEAELREELDNCEAEFIAWSAQRTEEIESQIRRLRQTLQSELSVGRLDHQEHLREIRGRSDAQVAELRESSIRRLEELAAGIAQAELHAQIAEQFQLLESRPRTANLKTAFARLLMEESPRLASL